MAETVKTLQVDLTDVLSQSVEAYKKRVYAQCNKHIVTLDAELTALRQELIAHKKHAWVGAMAHPFTSLGAEPNYCGWVHSSSGGWQHICGRSREKHEEFDRRFAAGDFLDDTASVPDGVVNERR